MEDIDLAAVVRGAEPDDLDAVFALARSMARTFVPERNSFTRSFRAVLDDPAADLLVVEVQCRVAGYLLGFEHPAFFANGRVAWVEEITVKAGLRRRRLGALLMSTYEETLSAQGVRLIALATTRASEFYEALDYTDHATYYRKLLH